ncbi:Hexokinase isoenzyme 2 [Aspergillus melleus]|uniref:Hexokinase isoenzyme 2 n=1 Tax=Aspergillus melleus TaxID=138277 RepID=UPI001E8D64B8|nr:Hexokinase isoenzyme 2 [Aspergillus melleus]KAH8425155.1 Hexokinase isoenzyme 2 [Aspergillus melleus]
MGDDGKYEILQEAHSIPSALKSGTASELWMFLAACLRQFIEKHNISTEELRKTVLGFTFSYPVTQNSITSGILQRWTKGFDVSEVERHDVVADVQDVFSRELAKDGVAHGGYTAINCEYGAFDNNRLVLPFTAYDDQIDRASPRPGQQRYEREVTLLDDQNISRLQEHILDCVFFETVENDPSENLDRCKGIFKERLSLHVQLAAWDFCRHLAQLVGQRAARLYACGITAAMKKASLKACHVAIDGSVFNKYPQCQDRVMEALEDILEWRRGNTPAALH